MAHLALEIATAHGIMGNLLRHAILVNKLLSTEQDATLNISRETENTNSLYFAVRYFETLDEKTHVEGKTSS